MKKVLSLLLALMMVFSVCTTVIFAEGERSHAISVQDAVGFPSQVTTVMVNIKDTYGISAANLKIKYDKRLELISCENGNFFNNMGKSAIYKQDTSGVNGEYIYIGINNGENSAKIEGTFVKLNFMIPADAQEGEEFKVEIAKKESVLATGVDATLNYSVTNGKITAQSANNCGDNHTYGEAVTVGVQSVLSNGYSYRICTACNYCVVEYSPATEFDVYEYLGTSINYTGKPSGIAPMFKVNMTALDAIKTDNPNCKVNAGIEIYKNGVFYDEESFYGEGASYELKDDVLFVKITDVSVLEEFTFKAYVKLSNSSTGEARTAYTVATVRDSEEISICDVVKCLDVNQYSKENKQYLKNILEGFID